MIWVVVDFCISIDLNQIAFFTYPPKANELTSCKIHMLMTSEEMKSRTKKFAMEAGKLTLELDKTDINRNYSNQLIRCSSSVAANYRAARRAKSKADFINKLKIVEEELDESLLFLELLAEFNPLKKARIQELSSEGEQLLKIIVATINSLRRKKKNP